MCAKTFLIKPKFVQCITLLKMTVQFSAKSNTSKSLIINVASGCLRYAAEVRSVFGRPTRCGGGGIPSLQGKSIAPCRITAIQHKPNEDVMLYSVFRGSTRPLGCMLQRNNVRRSER